MFSHNNKASAKGRLIPLPLMTGRQGKEYLVMLKAYEEVFKKRCRRGGSLRTDI